MLKNDIEYYQFRISEEERLAEQAPFPEAGLGHSQMAMRSFGYIFDADVEPLF